MSYRQMRMWLKGTILIQSVQENLSTVIGRLSSTHHLEVSCSKATIPKYFTFGVQTDMATSFAQNLLDILSEILWLSDISL